MQKTPNNAKKIELMITPPMPTKKPAANRAKWQTSNVLRLDTLELSSIKIDDRHVQPESEILQQSRLRSKHQIDRPRLQTWSRHEQDLPYGGWYPRSRAENQLVSFYAPPDVGASAIPGHERWQLPG
jgi:hypothetical protein